jgi:crotonobetainyl-CoA:carnitine CoA-transferase CaiB-like acyl-CoA transferase
MTAPLQEINILDLSNLLPGPYATWVLSQMGANVTKVEKPKTGDMMRQLVPATFEAMNRGKKSVVLDLKKPEGKDVLIKMIKDSDVLVEGFRPGVVKRLGIDYEAVKIINPGIIYCSISGYGQDGSYSLKPGHDINYLGLSGILSVSGDPKEPPATPGGIQLADLSASLFALINIFGALLERQQSGKGKYLDISITDASAALAIPRMAEYFGAGSPSKEKFMSRAGYGVYEAKDHLYFTLACIEEQFWQNLCKLLGEEQLLEKQEYQSYHSRCQHADELNALLSNHFQFKTREEWLMLFDEHDIPAGPAYQFDEVVKDPLLKERSIFATLLGNNDASFAAVFDERQEKAPELGQDSVDVLSQYIAEKDLEQLISKGIVGTGNK